MASHDTFGLNGVPLNRREILTLTGAASAVATTQAFANAASAAADHPPHIVMDDALTLADTIRSRQVSCIEVMTNYLERLPPRQALTTRVCRSASKSSVPTDPNCRACSWLMHTTQQPRGRADDLRLSLMNHSPGSGTSDRELLCK